MLLLNKDIMPYPVIMQIQNSCRTPNLSRLLARQPWYLCLPQRAPRVSRIPDTAKGQVARRHPGRYRRRGAATDPATRQARQGVGRALCPSAAGVGAGGGNVRRQDRGTLEENGAVAVSQECAFEHLVDPDRQTHQEMQPWAGRTIDTLLMLSCCHYGGCMPSYQL